MGRSKTGAPCADKAASKELSSSKYLHGNLWRDEYRSLWRNMSLKRNKYDRLTKPVSALLIDDEIERLILAESNQRPRIDLSLFENNGEQDPYDKIRFGICQAVIAADLEVRIAHEEYKKYKKSKDIIDITSEALRLCLNISNNYEPDDFVPSAPIFLPDLVKIDLTRECRDLLAVSEVTENIQRMNSAARDIVDAKEKEYINGGRPKNVWERSFAEHIADNWRAITGEDIRGSEHTGHLASFIGKSFDSLYKSFEINVRDAIYKDFRVVSPTQNWKAYATLARDAVAARDAHEREMWERDPSRGEKLKLIGRRADGSPLYESKIVVKTIASFEGQLRRSWARGMTVPKA